MPFRRVIIFFERSFSSTWKKTEPKEDARVPRPLRGFSARRRSGRRVRKLARLRRTQTIRALWPVRLVDARRVTKDQQTNPLQHLQPPQKRSNFSFSSLIGDKNYTTFRRVGRKRQGQGARYSRRIDIYAAAISNGRATPRLTLFANPPKRKTPGDFSRGFLLLMIQFRSCSGNRLRS